MSSPSLSPTFACPHLVSAPCVKSRLGTQNFQIKNTCVVNEVDAVVDFLGVARYCPVETCYSVLDVPSRNSCYIERVTVAEETEKINISPCSQKEILLKIDHSSSPPQKSVFLQIASCTVLSFFFFKSKNCQAIARKQTPVYERT